MNNSMNKNANTILESFKRVRNARWLMFALAVFTGINWLLSLSDSNTFVMTFAYRLPLIASGVTYGIDELKFVAPVFTVVTILISVLIGILSKKHPRALLAGAIVWIFDFVVSILLYLWLYELGFSDLLVDILIGVVVSVAMVLGTIGAFKLHKVSDDDIKKALYGEPYDPEAINAEFNDVTEDGKDEYEDDNDEATEEQDGDESDTDTNNEG